jgi:hypothetical protein
VATRSPDDKVEYLHVLKAPTDGSKILKLPPPADGKRFSKAVLLVDKKTVALKQDESGLSLALPTGSSWDRINTVIALAVADDSPVQNVAHWKACRASSHADNASHPSKATDGAVNTAWSSHPDDARPWLIMDLALPCAIRRIEASGPLATGDMVRISDTMDFTNAKPLATFKSAPGATLEIKKATYGKDAQIADVTEKVRQAVVSDSLNLTAENSLSGGDPAPSVPKELRVEFSFNGEDGIKVIPEGQSISIGAAKPWIIEVPAGTTARFIRLERAQAGPSMKVNELQVYGSFR